MRSDGRLRRDLALWLGTTAVAAVATAIAYASGARLGAALTLGLAVTIALVLGALGREALARRTPPGSAPTQPAPPAKVPSRGRATRRRR